MMFRRADSMCLSTVTPEIPVISTIPVLITIKMLLKNTHSAIFAKTCKKLFFSYSSVADVTKFVLNISMYGVLYLFGHLYQN